MLTLVGTGYNVAGQVTPEARGRMEQAEHLFYLVSDPATAAWLRGVHPGARSLHDCYGERAGAREATECMVGRLLAPLRRGASVCAAFTGHPAVFLFPAHEALRRARREGFPARMLPAISIEDCLIADLGVDPATCGRCLFEATDFIVRPRRFDPRSALVLLQVGAIGLGSYRPGTEPNRDGLDLLVEVLLRHYPAGHEAVLYELPQLPLFEPRVERVAVGKLAAAQVSVVSTLYVPPLEPAPLEPAALDRLGLSRRQ